MKIVLDTNCLVSIIVTNDRHFQELKRYDFPKVSVRTLAEFLEIVREL